MESTDLPAAIRRGTPSFRAAVLGLLAAGFSTFAVLYCTQPLLPLLARDFGVSAATSSLSISFATGALAPAMLIAGPLSDARGRKNLMVIGLLISSLLTILLAVAPHWWELLAIRAAQGLALSGVTAVAMAYVAEEMHSSAISLAMGLYIGGNALGGMSGRLVTGVVADLVSWRFALFVTGLFALGCALMVWRLLPASRRFVARRARPAAMAGSFINCLRDPGLRLLFLAPFLLMGSFVTIYNYLSFRLLAPPFGLGQAEVGLIFALYLVGMAGSWSAGLASGRVSRGVLMIGATLLMAAGLLATMPNSLLAVLVGLGVFTFGFFAAHSVASAWVGRRAGSAKGAASALYLLFYYTGSSLAGWLGGLFWSDAGWLGVAGFVGLLLAGGLVVGVRLHGLVEEAG